MLQSLKNNRILRVCVGLLCLLYLLFPSFGVFELIPDNIPFIGNFDEFAVAFVMISAFDLIPWVNSPSRLRMVMLGVIGVVSFIYLLNPTAGLIELIPDNFPIVGNIDEAVATLGLVTAYSQMAYNRSEDKRRNDELALNNVRLPITYE